VFGLAGLQVRVECAARVQENSIVNDQDQRSRLPGFVADGRVRPVQVPLLMR